MKCLQQVEESLCENKSLVWAFKASLVLLFKRPCISPTGCYDDNTIEFNLLLYAGTYIFDLSPISSVSLQVN